jgi:hypothetical protein
VHQESDNFMNDADASVGSSNASRSSTSGKAEFMEQFLRHARAVKRARFCRATLTGLGVGLLLAALGLALCFWALPQIFAGTLPRVLALALSVFGALGGAALSLAQPWTAEEVGLFLDARLAANNAVSTALAPQTETRFLPAVYHQAAELLRKRDVSVPRRLRRAHIVIPLASVALVPLLWLRPTLPPAPPPAAGSEALTISSLEGLEALEALEELSALEADDQQKLRALAEQARELKRQLQSGIERRKAQASIAKLQDEVNALLGELASAKNRAGLSAAVELLRQEAATREAAKALGNGDLVRFDEEMQKLAQAAEEHARTAAKEALNEALKAAQQRGAKALSSALAEQQKLFEQREHSAKLLRELASSLPSALQQALNEALNNKVDNDTTQRLADAFEKALEELSPEERKALGERLRKAIEDGSLDGQNGDQGQLQKLGKQLEQGQGQQELRDLLKQLAKPSSDAEKMQGLRGAEEGLRRAQRQVLGALPVPQASPQGGSKGAGSPGAAPGDNGGPGRGPGTGDHNGTTAPVDGEELRAQADPRLNKGLPLLSAGQGRTTARPGERAMTPEQSALSGVSADELQGVEHSTIPEEYREQVSRYFAP